MRVAKRPKFHRIFKIEGSTILHSVAYDPQSYVLDVKLKSGDLYRYQDVSSWAFMRLVTSASPGKAYNNLIKRHGEWDTAGRKAVKLRRTSL